MAAKWPDPASEYIQSPDKPGIRELAARWKQAEKTLFRRSKAENWTEKREQFGRGLAAKTAEKTAAKIEVVAEAHADATATIVAEQLKNYRGAISTLVNVLSKAQREILRRPEMLQGLADGDLMLGIRRMTDGMDRLIKGQRVVQGLDKADRPDAPPPVQVQVLQVAMADPETRRMIEQLSLKLSALGGGDGA